MADESKKKKILKSFQEVLYSIVPDSYPRFSEKRIIDGAKYFAFLLVLTLLTTGVLMAFVFPSISSQISEKMGNFEKLNINVSMELKEDIVFGKNLRIAENATYNNNEKFLITKENIYIQKPICFMLPFCFSKPIKIDTQELSTPLDFKGNVSKIFNALMIMFFPIILIGIISYVLLKAISLMLIFYFLSFLITKSAKLKLNKRPRFLVCLYALTPFIIMEPFSILLGGIYMAHLIVFVILLVIGIFLVGEKKHRF